MRFRLANACLAAATLVLGCDPAGGSRGAAAAGKADDPGLGGAGLDPELIAVLDAAANHLGDASTWDDPPAPGQDPTQCAGNCGSGTVDGSCYCDAACQGLGDCCDDYEDACGDGGGSSSTGGESGGELGSCYDNCGGMGSDGVCYCDDYCEVDLEECCEDYINACGDGSVADREALATRSEAVAASACLALVDADVDVAKILRAAGRSGAKQGARCFAGAVVASTATAGTAAPASAVVCVANIGGAGAYAAALEYFRQKRGDIAVCALEVAGQAAALVIASAPAIGVFEGGSDAPCPPCPMPSEPPKPDRVDCVPPSREHAPCPDHHWHVSHWEVNQDPKSCDCFNNKREEVVCYEPDEDPDIASDPIWDVCL